MKITPRYDGPPLLSMEGSPDDQSVPVRRQRERMESMLADLSDDQWAAESRCAGWSVQDVIAHVIGVNRFWRASVLAGLAGEPTRMLTGFDPAVTPDLMVEPMRALSPGEILEQLVSSNAGFLDALDGLDEQGWSALAEAPPGHVPVRMIAAHALWDTWIHERDIALPLGLTPPIEPDETRSAIRYAAALSPGFLIAAGRTPEGTYAVETTDPDDRFSLEIAGTVAVRDGELPPGAPCLRGDTVAVIEALSIRAPLPATAPPEWRELLIGLATAFDALPENV